eukprot:symbB.v1.2.022786.t3/scaffold2040.1/size91418/2
MVLLKDENLSPDVITYNAFLNACERARQWQRALVTLEEMQREDLTPDIISFSSAMAACELCARWDLALTLLSQARAAKLDLTLAACSTAVSACAQGRKWRWAMRLFEAARPLGLDVGDVASVVESNDIGSCHCICWRRWVKVAWNPIRSPAQLQWRHASFRRSLVTPCVC